MGSFVDEEFIQSLFEFYNTQQILYRTSIGRIKGGYGSVVYQWREMLPEHKEKIAGNLRRMQEYRNGKLYTCNYAAYASVAEIIVESDETKTYDFHVHKREDKKARWIPVGM